MTQREHDYTENDAASEQENESPSANVSEEDAKLWQERALRYAAEAENILRRAEKEIASARDYAVERFAKDMTAVLDQLYLASDAADRSQATLTAGDEGADAGRAFASLSEGVKLTLREMTAALERAGVIRFNPSGEKFDSNRCQAVMQRPGGEGVEPGVVLETFACGYTIKDRLLKPAMVVVSA